MKKPFLVVAALVLLAACGSQEAAPEDDAEPMLDIGNLSSADATKLEHEYHATTRIDCAIDGQEIKEGCLAGVVRGWGTDGSSLVEITKPDGLKRAIFVGPDGTPFGADSAEADGSAGWDLVATRDGDMVTVELGAERYSWPEAFAPGD